MKNSSLYGFAVLLLTSCAIITPPNSNSGTAIGTMSMKGQTYTFYTSDTATCSISPSNPSITNTSGSWTGTLNSANISFRNAAGASLTLTVASSQSYGENYVVSETITQGSNGDTITFAGPTGSTFSTALGSTAGTTGCSYNFNLSSSKQLTITCTNVSGTTGDQASMVANLTCPN